MEVDYHLNGECPQVLNSPVWQGMGLQVWAACEIRDGLQTDEDVLLTEDVQGN